MRKFRSITSSTDANVYVGPFGEIVVDDSGVLRIHDNTTPGGSTVQSGVVESSTPPDNPTANSIWYDEVSGHLFVYYEGVWVAASGLGASSIPSETPEFNPTTLVQNVSITSASTNGGDGNFRITYTVNSYATVNTTGVVATCDGITVYAEGTAATGSQTVSGGFGYGHPDQPYDAYAFVTTNVGTIWSTLATGYTGLCLAAGTMITLADGSSKPIETITYDDEIRVWDFDLGRFSSAKPLWIKRSETATAYNVLTFSDGSTLHTIDQHRIFNTQAGAFTYPMTDDTPLGTLTFNASGDTVALAGKTTVTGAVDYYNVITDHHMNLFADGILTSCRFNNLYPIADMRFSKDSRAMRSTAEFNGVPTRFIDGLRLREQESDISMIKWYVARLLSLEVQEQLALA